MKIYDYYTITEKRSNNNAWNDYYTIKRVDVCKDDFFPDIKISFWNSNNEWLLALQLPFADGGENPGLASSGVMSFSMVESYFLYLVAGTKLFNNVVIRVKG